MIAIDDDEMVDAGAARLRELERLAVEKLTNRGVSSMTVAPPDSRIQDKKAGKPSDNTLRAIRKTADDDTFCPPRSSGAGTGDRTADAVQGELP
jgi:hypothetical protein